MHSDDMGEPSYLDEPYPLDHTITWREHFAQKQEHDERGSMNTITELATRIAKETDTRRVAVLDVLRWLDRNLGQVTDQITDEDDCEPGTRDWWVENANVNDAEDCEACEGDLCPVHYGISLGIDLMAKKIAALGDDPELFALIPDPVKAPGGDGE